MVPPKAVTTAPLIYCLIFALSALWLRANAQTGGPVQVLVPGTKVLMAPPPGFVPASSFSGFQKGTVSAIAVYDLPGDDYYRELLKSIPDSLEARSEKVYEYKDVTIAGYPAKCYLVQSVKTKKAYNILFGDHTFCVMALGVFAPDDEATGRQLKNALLGCGYSKGATAAPAPPALFTFNNAHSRFALAKSSDGEYLYSIGGVYKDEYNEAFLTVAVLNAPAGVTPQSLAENDRTGTLQNWAGKKYTEKGRAVTINGYEAYEEEVMHHKNTAHPMYYQVVVKSGTKALAIQCKSPASSKSEMDAMKKFIGTIRFR